MLYISGRFAFSNGDEVIGGIKGTTSNGTNYVLINHVYVVITEKLVDSVDDPQAKLTAFENGVLNIWPVNQFGGKDLLADYKTHLLSVMALHKKQKVYDAKLKVVIDKYKHLPIEVIDTVKNFDHTYEYSDDSAVYTRAKAREIEIKEILKQYDAVSFFKEYSLAVFSYSDC